MILLYNPKSNDSGKAILPMSLLALGAVLEGQHEYCIVDGNLDADPAATLDRLIRETGAHVLGVTVMPGPQLARAVPHCCELKRRHPGLVVVWGGYFPTQHWDVCLRSGFVDYVVRGHGEMVFLDLLSYLQAGSPPPASIAGLAYRRADIRPTEQAPSAQESQFEVGNLDFAVCNPLAPIPHPAHLPDFPYHRLEMARYVRRTFLGARTLPHHSSYGCPFFCNFCAVVNMVNGRWLPQPAVQVADVVRNLVENWRVDAVEFYDNNFFTHEGRTAEFAERVRPYRIGWWGEARIDTLLKYSPRTWELMRASGLKMVFMGAESGSAETLRRMDKGGTMRPDKTLEIARLMQSYGVIPEFSFVLGSPPDSEGDIRETLEFIRKVKRVNPQSEIVMYLYTPVPLAGDLYDTAQAEGFAFPQTLDEWVSEAWLNFSQRRSATLPWLKQPARARLHDFERVLNAYYPTATNPRLTEAWKRLLRTAAAWRYHLRFYRWPLELRALQRLVAYQRPETSGF